MTKTFLFSRYTTTTLLRDFGCFTAMRFRIFGAKMRWRTLGGRITRLRIPAQHRDSYTTRDSLYTIALTRLTVCRAGDGVRS